MNIQNLSNEYILKNVNLTVPENKIVTLLGPSGSGKSTLLKILAGIEKYSAGTVDIGTSNIGMVFQNYNLFPKMTAKENVEFPLRVKKLDIKRAAEYLDLVGMSNYATYKPEQLSGGQQQRVALARALCYHPDCVLLDEPLGSLDTLLRNQLQNDIKRIQNETGCKMLYVTHDIAEAFMLGDIIAIMKNGRIQIQDTPKALYYCKEDPWVESFIHGGLAHIKRIQEIVK